MEILSVQNIQPSDQSSTLMLSKLLEVDSELEAQAAQLMAQIESIEEKRKSLKTVISMFTARAENPTGVSTEELTEKPVNGNGKEPEPENITESSSVSSPISTTEPESTTGADTPAKKGRRKAPSRSSDKAEKDTSKAQKDTDKVQKEPNKAQKDTDKAQKDTSKAQKDTDKVQKEPNKAQKDTKTAKTGKATKKSPNWRQYLRAEFSQNSIPQAVAAVLQSQPEHVFDIATIVNTIFVDELPKETRSRAREVVSNTLSEGLRDKKWYRGKIGFYSLSRASAQKNMAS